MAFKNSNLRCLSTNRLFLRPMLASDAGQVVAWRNSEHVAKMSSQSIKADLTEEHHLEWFFESRNSRIDYLIIHKKLEQPIGSLSFKFIKVLECQACGELGKYIGETSALGKGFAFEATRRWIEFGFADLGLETIVSKTRYSNAANIRLNEKLGFKIEPFPDWFFPGESGWLFMRLSTAK